MKKEKRSIKIQVRVTQAEKSMLDEMASDDKNFSISSLVREAIYEKYKATKTQ